MHSDLFKLAADAIPEEQYKASIVDKEGLPTTLLTEPHTAKMRNSMNRASTMPEAAKKIALRTTAEFKVNSPEGEYLFNLQAVHQS